MSVDLVTGAFGYTGSRIAARLLERGRVVRTLTRRPPGDHQLAGRVDAVPLCFDGPEALRRAFEGVETLYLTYWRRFPTRHGGFESILAEATLLLEAARDAGARVVLFSVSNASANAPTDYFRAKARLEARLRALGIRGAIVRPTLLFGPGDILVNNLAWTLRRAPLVGIPGAGDYRVQPVHVADVADIAVRLGLDEAAFGTGDDIQVVDAAGTEILRFRDFVELVRASVGSRARVVQVPPTVALLAARSIGLFVRDVVLTRDEVVELTSELLVSDSPPTGSTSFSGWLAAESDGVGRRWSSELARNYRALPA